MPRALLAILALALVVRLALIAATPHYLPHSPFDAWDYDRHAQSIASGHGFPPWIFHKSSPSAYRPPLYPYLLAATYKLAPGTFTAGRALNALLGTVAVLLIFLIADRLWGPRPAVAAGALSAVFPPLVVLNASANVEPLFIALELGMVLSLLVYRDAGRGYRWALLAGALCGLATLTRSNGFVLALPLLLALPAGGVGLRARLAPAALALLVAALVVSPWTIRNAVVFHGKFIPVSNTAGYALAGIFNDESRHDPNAKGAWRAPHRDLSNLPIYLHAIRPPYDYDEADVDRALAKKALRYIRDNPGYAVEAVGLNVYRLMAPGANALTTRLSYDAMGVPQRLRRVVTYSYYPVALLALVGLAMAISRRRLGPLWLWSLPVLLGLSFAVLAGDPRYRTTLDPFLLLLAGFALESLAARANIEWPVGNETRLSRSRSEEKIL
jgi:4-amino-4-deoxy-L-arabinose transferase-like glycosyltransferase